MQALTVTDLGVDFPHAAQVAKVVRHRTDTKSGKQSRETVYVITDLTSRQASPERIAKILRTHWVIENRLHFVRDTAFREDASKIRTGHGPENMATLRSFAINQLRTTGRTNTPPDSARQPSAPTSGHWPSSDSTDLHQRTINELCHRPWYSTFFSR
ncbi:ISAs1 family transposase [Streptomyces soliscabiei]|uniref:ISAs1 family transposase n=1 Tax=Streptomyces soliscabiei TaxID=588897 RepID=UPI0029BC4555|nr:ISAs1 family transposase [Streptomyces sp. NY05-11A]MDX2678129.1 ISAs1 family transposase [Streptomyces sp. NY05-11A]